MWQLLKKLPEGLFSPCQSFLRPAPWTTDTMILDHEVKGYMLGMAEW